MANEKRPTRRGDGGWSLHRRVRRMMKDVDAKWPTGGEPPASGPRHLYRLLRGDADWRAAVAGDDHWYRDEKCTVPASAQDLDRADDDVWTGYGPNLVPRHYPVLAWKEIL